MSVRTEMNTNVIVLPGTTTVAEAVRAVQASDADALVVQLSAGGHDFRRICHPPPGRPPEKQCLEAQLDDLADLMGDAILQMRLEDLPDPKWPHRPWLTAWAEIDLSGGQDVSSRQYRKGGVVLEGNEVIGVLLPRVTVRGGMAGGLPTTLFGERYVFGREGAAPGPEGSRQCSNCQKTFAYYKPVIEGGKVTGYACPHCGARK